MIDKIYTLTWSLITIILFSVQVPGKAILSLHPDSLTNAFYNQLLLYPQEKIYVQTDKSYYITGEDIWFRAHLTDAQTHQPDTNSRYVYGELINPFNHVVKRVKIKPEQGAYSGYIPLTDDLPEGDYQLRFYTKSMQQIGDDYFYKKRIRIGGPQSVHFRLESIFTYKNENKQLQVDISVKEIIGESLIIPEKIELDEGKENKRNLRPDKEGKISVTYRNIENLPSSLLISYEYKGKRHQQFISIPPTSGDFAVSFFPEGGQTPEGVFNRVAFKAINTNRLGEDITGIVINGKGDTLGQFISAHKGMGILLYKAEKNEVLYAICKNKKNIEKTFQLPQAVPGGLSLYTNLVREKWYIAINKSAETLLPNTLYLLVLNRGLPISTTLWDKKKTVVSLPVQGLPTGILHFLLVDENKNPISERLVFNHNPIDIANVEIKTDKEAYQTRELIDISIHLMDYENIPLTGDFSISITDNQDIYPDETSNILTSLLLTSDLKGYIEEPGYYFKNKNSKTAEHLDILLMTQGWRRYDVQKILQGTPEELKIFPEWSQRISGTVKGGIFMNKPSANYPVSLLATNIFYYDETVTDENGKFIFTHFELPDTTHFVIQSKTPKGKTGVELVIDEELFPAIGSLLPLLSIDKSTKGEENTFEQYIKKADRHFVNQHGIRTIHLDDVVVTAPEIKRNRSIFSSMFNKEYNREELEKIRMPDTHGLLNALPEVTVRNKKVYLRRYQMGTGDPGLPLILLDDFEISADIIDTIHPNDIDRIEIVQGAQANIFGSKAYYGAILIFTKKGVDLTSVKELFNIKHITPLGYQINKEFYSPKYDVQQEEEVFKPDLRTTLYWNPSVRTDEKGKVSVDFYSADSKPDYTMRMEGLTPDGILIYATKQIGRNK